MKYIKNDISPIQLKKGIDQAAEQIIEFYNEISLPCEKHEEFYRIAMVSSNYDANIADVVSRAV